MRGLFKAEEEQQVSTRVVGRAMETAAFRRLSRSTSPSARLGSRGGTHNASRDARPETRVAFWVSQTHCASRVFRCASRDALWVCGSVHNASRDALRQTRDVQPTLSVGSASRTFDEAIRDALWTRRVTLTGAEGEVDSGSPRSGGSQSRALLRRRRPDLFLSRIRAAYPLAARAARRLEKAMPPPMPVIESTSPPAAPMPASPQSKPLPGVARRTIAGGILAMLLLPVT